MKNSKLQARMNERAVENNDVFIEDLRAWESMLRVKLEYVEKERDSLRGLMETLKKEILEFEESRRVLESRLCELEEKLKDSSKVKFDLESRLDKLDRVLSRVQVKGDRFGIGYDDRVVPIPKANTNRVREPTRKVRRGRHFGNHSSHLYTFTHCGRKGQLGRFFYDLRNSLRKLRNKVASVPKTPMHNFTLTWVRKSDFEALGVKLHGSHLIALDSSHARSKG